MDNDEMIDNDEMVDNVEMATQVDVDVVAEKSAISNRQKWLISVMSGFLAMLIFNPWLFSLVNMVTTRLGPASFVTASVSGCPTIPGLILHGIVFVLISRLLMW